MVIGDGQSCAVGLAVERGCQSDAAIYVSTIRVAMLGEQILS